MTANYEIRISDALKQAGAIFCKGPEVFVAIAFAVCGGTMMLSHFPVVGQLFTLLLGAIGPAAIYLAAEEGAREEKISFSALNPLATLAPQLLMLSVIKGILITLGLFFFVLPGIYLAVIFVFAELFVVLEGKNFVDALKASKHLAEQNLMGIFGLCFFLAMLAFSGLLLIGLGLLVTLPMALLVLFSVYRRVHIRVL